MGVIQQLERLERRTPRWLRATVWASLRVPHRMVRHHVIADYLASHPVRKLQIGSGGNILLGWLNSDLNPVRSMGVYLATLHRPNESVSSVEDGRVRGRRHPLRDVIFVDATKKLPFPDGAFDNVFSEHMIEHLCYRDAMRLIKELHRVLKPGGRVRISTPDLRFLIDLYAQDKTDVQKRYMAWASTTFLPSMECLNTPSDDADAFVVNNFVRNWGHQFIFDQKTLGSALARCGFCAITRHQPGESDDENLQNIECHGRQISNDFNQMESLVLEATKPV
jgi:predicted SAM-dependent methyltransferase